jgi:hypothetical protein
MGSQLQLGLWWVGIFQELNVLSGWKGRKGELLIHRADYAVEGYIRMYSRI